MTIQARFRKEYGRDIPLDEVKRIINSQSVAIDEGIRNRDSIKPPFIGKFTFSNKIERAENHEQGTYHTRVTKKQNEKKAQKKGTTFVLPQKRITNVTTVSVLD